MTTTRTFGFALVVITGIAGTVLSASATLGGAPCVTLVQAGPDHEFRSCKWLGERKVVNNNNEEVATISDFIIDRGSGRLDYAVLKSGGVLGLGGKNVAMTYGSLRWDDAQARFVLAMTPEQLKQLPEFNADEWTCVAQPGEASKKSALRDRLAADASLAARDPYAASLADAKKTRITGEVTSVERVRLADAGEHIIVTVKTDDGTRRVALGPTWYVNTGVYVPMRGDKVVMQTLALPRDADKLLVAQSVKSGDHSIELRGDDGSPAWVVKAQETPEQRTHCARRYLLLSELNGARVDCRGSECGKVHDVILERRSGDVAFLSIDPNQNFLGISDTKRLVPWSVAVVSADGKVRLDASKEMVLASPETPADAQTLNSGGLADMVYKAYEVKPPEFRAMKPVAAPEPAGTDAWAKGGAICSAVQKDSLRTLTGTMKGTEEIRFGETVTPGSAITVEQGTDKTVVILGPAWYMKNQKLACNANDPVKVEAYRTTINGKEHLIARSIECRGTRTVLIEDSGPVWDRREK